MPDYTRCGLCGRLLALDDAVYTGCVLRWWETGPEAGGLRFADRPVCPRCAERLLFDKPAPDPDVVTDEPPPG